MADIQDIYAQLYPNLASGLARQLGDIRTTPVQPRENVSAGFYTPIVTTQQTTQQDNNTLRRLAFAALYGLGEIPATIADIPGYISEHIAPLPWPGGLPKAGAASRAWHDYIQRTGNLEGTTGEMLASMVGSAVPYMLSWPASVGALSTAAKGVSSAAKARQLAATGAQASRAAAIAAQADKFAKFVTAPKGIPQYAAREALIASTLYPIIEAPRPEELKVPLPVYAGTAALGGALAGKLAKGAGAKAARGALADAAESMQAGTREPVNLSAASDLIPPVQVPPSATTAVTLTPIQRSQLAILREYRTAKAVQYGKRNLSPSTVKAGAKRVGELDEIATAFEQGTLTAAHVQKLDKTWNNLVRYLSKGKSKDAVQDRELFNTLVNKYNFADAFTATKAAEAVPPATTQAPALADMPTTAGVPTTTVVPTTAGVPTTTPAITQAAAPPKPTQVLQKAAQKTASELEADWGFLRNLSTKERDDYIAARALAKHWERIKRDPKGKRTGVSSSKKYAEIAEAVKNGTATKEQLDDLRLGVANAYSKHNRKYPEHNKKFLNVYGDVFVDIVTKTQTLTGKTVKVGTKANNIFKASGKVFPTSVPAKSAPAKAASTASSTKPPSTKAAAAKTTKTKDTLPPAVPFTAAQKAAVLQSYWEAMAGAAVNAEGRIAAAYKALTKEAANEWSKKFGAAVKQIKTGKATQKMIDAINKNYDEMVQHSKKSAKPATKAATVADKRATKKAPTKDVPAATTAAPTASITAPPDGSSVTVTITEKVGKFVAGTSFSGKVRYTPGRAVIVRSDGTSVSLPLRSIKWVKATPPKSKASAATAKPVEAEPTEAKSSKVKSSAKKGAKPAVAEVQPAVTQAAAPKVEVPKAKAPKTKAAKAGSNTSITLVKDYKGLKAGTTIKGEVVGYSSEGVTIVDTKGVRHTIPSDHIKGLAETKPVKSNLPVDKSFDDLEDLTGAQLMPAKGMNIVATNLKTGAAVRGKVVGFGDGKIIIAGADGSKKRIPINSIKWAEDVPATAKAAPVTKQSTKAKVEKEPSDADLANVETWLDDVPDEGYFSEEIPDIDLEVPVVDRAPVQQPARKSQEKTAYVNRFGITLRKGVRVVPGSDKWNEYLAQLEPSQRYELDKKAAAFWNGLKERLLRDVKGTITLNDIRNLPEVRAVDGTTVAKVIEQLKARDVKVELPEAIIKTRLKLTPGSTISVDEIVKVPEVKNREVDAVKLVKYLKNEGVNVTGDTINLYSGIPLPELISFFKTVKSKLNRRTFIPITEISAKKRSLPLGKMGLLPDDVARQLDQLDDQAALINHHIERLVITEGTRPEMSAKAIAKHDKLCLALAKVAEKRDKLLQPVNIDLGNAAKGKYAHSVLNKLNTEHPIKDAIAFKDNNGHTYAHVWISPLKGTRVDVPMNTPITKFDEQVWRSPLGVLDYITPLRSVLGEKAFRPLRNAARVENVFNQEFESELYKVLKPVLKGSQKSRTEALNRLTLILEGNKPKKAAAAEYSVAKNLRKWYDRLFAEFGIDPNRYFADYAPRIREHGSVLKAFGGKPPKELQFFAELERSAKDITFPTELNALTAALAYLRLGSRKKFLQPAFDMIAPMRAMMHPDRRRLADDVINSILHRPVWEERLVNGAIENSLRALGVELGPNKNRLASQISKLGTYLIYQSTLAFNPMSALKNTTQAMLATLTVDANIGKGLVLFSKALRDLGTKEGRVLLEHCWVLQHRAYLEGLERQSSVIRKTYGKVEKAGMAMFQGADSLNVALSYLMKVRQCLENGLSKGEAIEAANTFAASTQFLYGIDSAMFFKHPAGRVLGVLMSWPINFLHLMHSNLTQGGRAEKAKAVQAVAGMTLLMHGLSKVTGLDFSSDTPLEVAKGWLPLTYLTGAGSTSIPVNIVKDMLKLGQTAITGTPAARDTAWNAVKSHIWDVVPMSTQGKRIWRGIKAAKDGGFVYEEQAGMPYKKYKMEPGELFRSFIGPTSAAKERRQKFITTERARQMYNYHRDKVVEAYLKGDKATVRKYQEEIIKRGGNPVTMADIRRRSEEAAKTAVERQAEMLPKGYVIPEPSIGTRLLQLMLNQSLAY